MELAEVEGEDLFDGENVRVASLCDLKPDFVVGHWDNFVSNISLLKLKLSSALSVHAEETGWAQDTVLEVPLDLSLD